MCGYVELTPEQKQYYKERKNKRHRLDLRGKELTLIPDPDAMHGEKRTILEIEEGLLKWWVNWQDQPDEIVVDSVYKFNTLLGKFTTRPAYWAAHKTKFSIMPAEEQFIPVFENV
jgi:hypothetical protein